MMNNQQLGLLRLTDFPHQDAILKDLNLSLTDVYDTIDQMRDNARELECTFKRIL
jgi:hypothetical protein